MKARLKWLLFPGLNLHARLRSRKLPKYIGRPSNGETRRVLDAGCGNGALAYQAYKQGNSVLGVSIKSEVQRNQQLFNGYLGIPEERLSFRDVNLYQIDILDEQFDEIICTEVMEHIKGDRDVCTRLFRVLKPGGVLHLCCPNADHPYHQAYPLDPQETGGHVRSGYSYQTYKELLEPIGFEVSPPMGLGGKVRQACNWSITRAQELFGLPAGLAAFALLSPWAVLDGDDPEVPFSLYVRATKPRAA
jgi:SAM-dependent methyltransferase